MGLGEVQGGSQEMAAVWLDGWHRDGEHGGPRSRLQGCRTHPSGNGHRSAAKHSRSIFSQVLEAIVWC